MEEGSVLVPVLMFFAIAYPIFPRPMKATPLMSQLEEDELILTELGRYWYMQCCWTMPSCRVGFVSTAPRRYMYMYLGIPIYLTVALALFTYRRVRTPRGSHPKCVIFDGDTMQSAISTCS